MASVDVVVPCYNYGRFLERCVSSLLRQVGTDVRVLIIDDASSDDSEAVGRALAASDPRIEYRRHTTNAGHIATYNEGLLGWARADYCLLISADDLVAPGAFARAAAIMDSHPEVAFTYGMAQVFTDDENPDEGQYRAPAEQIVWPGNEYLRTTCEVGNLVATPSVIVRTSVQKRVGGYRPELPHTGDMEMWMRLAVHGDVGVVRGVQSYYRVHGSNMSTAYYGRRVRDTAEQVHAFQAIVDKYADRIPQLGGWSASAYRRIATSAIWLAGDAFEEGDIAATNYCLELACKLWPEVRHTTAWRKFRIKRLMGRKLMQTMRRFMQRFGLMSEVNMAAAGSLYVLRGRELGWWPTAQSPGGAAASATS